MSRPALTWRRGYPAARLLASGQVAGLTFWLQERPPGTVPGRVPDWLLPEILRLNDAQAGLGDSTRPLHGLIAAPLTAGGDGYCLHATLEARIFRQGRVPGAAPLGGPPNRVALAAVVHHPAG